MHIWEYMDDKQETEAPKPYARLIYGILRAIARAKWPSQNFCEEDTAAVTEPTDLNRGFAVFIYCIFGKGPMLTNN
jgi:hypothetical protein